MNIKRIKKITVNSMIFAVKWDKEYKGASFQYEDSGTGLLRVGLGGCDDIFELLCHELWEIVAVEMHVRHYRTDCQDDYIFVYDHRQHTTMCAMFAGLLKQFIKE